MENSSMVAHLSLNLLHVAWRHVAIASKVSEVRLKASVLDLSAMLEARFDTQLLHYVKF
jgi:hypothetical protein